MSSQFLTPQSFCFACDNYPPALHGRQRLGEAVNEAKRIVIGFGREHKLGEKAAAAWENGNKGVENLCEDVRKRSVEFERRYELRSRSRVAAAQVRSKLAEIDKAYDVRSNWERFLAYAQINLPKARRRVQMAYATPLGKIILVLLLGWMLASGFFFEILNFMFVVMMLGPFFLPPFMQWWLKNNTVRGACPSCGTKYFGRKDRKHICATCRAVVWKPRDDYMDNGTIDVEVGPVPA
eukprot:jgi/Mesvir1/12850/Mv05880-RA.1